MIIASVSSRTSPPDLVVVGDVMLDVSVSAPALAAGGDVRGSVRVRPGGGGANAAAWAAVDGARVRLHGTVGEDPAGRLLASALRERGVQARLRVAPGRPTGTMLVVRESGDRSMVSDRGANALLSPVLPGSSLRTGAILVSAYALFDRDSEAAARAILARAGAGVIAVDAASWPLLEAFGPDRFLEATARANLLLVNEREAKVLAGGTALNTLTERYRDVFVKRGAGGASHGRGERWTSVTALSVPDPADSTGAGDAFAGVLLARLARGAGVDEAMERACTAGAEVARSGENWPMVAR
jgi:sugar/nucleoside kinase (ribokinase family)